MLYLKPKQENSLGISHILVFLQLMNKKGIWLQSSPLPLKSETTMSSQKVNHGCALATSLGCQTSYLSGQQLAIIHECETTFISTSVFQTLHITLILLIAWTTPATTRNSSHKAACCLVLPNFSEDLSHTSQSAVNASNMPLNLWFHWCFSRNKTFL